MNIDPKISIIIPCYKQAHFLNESIASVKAQTITSWEIIVVDDGSPDDTAAVAANLAADDNRIKLIRKNNGGLSSARNFGLAECKGEFIQFLDADDFLLPYKFEEDLNAIEKKPNTTVVICDYLFFNENGTYHNADFCQPRFISKEPLLDLIMLWEVKLSIPPHCFLMRRDLFTKNSIQFSETLTNHEDWAAWMDIFRLKPNFTFTKRVAAHYRKHPTSMSSDPKTMYSGYLKALEAQIPFHQRDTFILRALNLKMRIVDISYEKNLAGLLSKMTKTRLFKRLAPLGLRYFAGQFLDKRIVSERYFNSMKSELQ